jgi:hypothetical protein
MEERIKMGYNKDNYKRIRTAYQTKYLAALEIAQQRTAQLHRESEEVARIDRLLSQTGAKIAMAALGTGESYRELLAKVERENLELQPCCPQRKPSSQQAQATSDRRAHGQMDRKCACHQRLAS